MMEHYQRGNLKQIAGRTGADGLSWGLVKWGCNGGSRENPREQDRTRLRGPQLGGGAAAGREGDRNWAEVLRLDCYLAIS